MNRSGGFAADLFHVRQAPKRASAGLTALHYHTLQKGDTQSESLRFRLRQPNKMSYRTIFSVVTEHTASTVMARYAIALAVACKAELILYAAHEEGSDETLLRHTDHHLDHLFAVAFELDIPVTRITEVGSIGRLLPKRVETENADLVFYPLTPYNQYGTDQQRHTVHRLLRSVNADLAIMRAISMAKPHPGHIMVPLGKDISNRESRLVFITALAKSFHAQVTLFHLFAERGPRKLPDTITRFREQLQEQHVSTLERSAAGDIGKAIRVEAITRRNDLIIIGASERGVLQKLLLGNPAADIMQQPPCNTILFRGSVP
jgi:nucleotide-binding universal stress UspA family protein